MIRRLRAPQRSAQYVWLITGPLALFTVACTVAFWVKNPDWYEHWLGGLIALAGICLAYAGVFDVVIRRAAYNIILTEIPYVLALFYLPPPLPTIAAVGAAFIIRGIRQKGHDATRTWFNVVKMAASMSAASLVVFTFLPEDPEAGPATWGVIAAALVVNVLVESLCIAAVMTVVHGVRAGQDVLRSAPPPLIISGVSIVLGLVFLVALEENVWSVLLLAVLTAALLVMLRSFADFFRQHRTLTEVYELTKAVREEGADGGLPDVLLGRVRALMRAEYATLWLAPQGRRPEVLLTARVESPALLDISPMPVAIRERVVTSGRPLALGGKDNEDPELRAALRESKIKNTVIVPLLSGQTTIGTLEVLNRLGEARSYRDEDARLLETIAVHTAAAVENARLVDRLRYDAYHDRLTGLANRRRITDALTESVRVRAEDDVVAILLFDVDGQRDVNESMGHAAGDKLLAEVAGRLRGIAGPGALVGRIGGDEFVVTLRAESVEATVRLATGMREQLRGHMTVGSLTLDLDTAVGVSVHPDHGSEPETLLQRAELAANAAKVLPYGVQLFHPSLESRAVRRLGIAADLRKALDDHELDVYFQPKVTLADRHLVGVECLARWIHPTHGEVAPEDFVAVAEHTGQLSRLTEQVLTEGLRRCREWADAERPLSIAVNLSVRTLLDSRFPDQVAELLKQYGVAAAQVTFEISEPGMLGDVERVLPTLYRLRDLGVRLSVDDFGTGASSLSYLRQWPVHEVKIDDSFVQGMATDSGDLAIVRAVVSLSREFGLTVVAEGVESELTLDLLGEMGCEIGQGYLFSRPLPYERLEAWFSAQTEPETTPTGEVRRLRAVI
jgi:diguanylate cyclase (GGDEF)-like protein